MNHPYHPRGPLIWLNQRHEFIQYFNQIYGEKRWSSLFDGLPKDCAKGGTGHGWCSEQVLIHTHLGAHIDAPLHYDPDTNLDNINHFEKCYGSLLC